MGNGAARVKNVPVRLAEKEAPEPRCVVLGFQAAWRRGVLEERLLSGRLLLAVLKLRGLCSPEGLRTCCWPGCVLAVQGLHLTF